MKETQKLKTEKQKKKYNNKLQKKGTEVKRKRGKSRHSFVRLMKKHKFSLTKGLTLLRVIFRLWDFLLLFFFGSKLSLSLFKAKKVSKDVNLTF